MTNSFIPKSSRSFATRWEELQGRPSGFDYMRISLAVCVLLWHSYQTSYGTDEALRVWKMPIGLLLEAILPLFFALSGFLVSGSFERSQDLKKFLTMRAIRIYPALCVEVILSALVLGPIVTTLPLSQYFLDRLFWHYGLNMMGWVHYFLPGVFANNVFPGIVNTSLWTVPFELECYIAISVLFLLGYMKYRWLVAPMFVAATIAISAFLIQKGESGTLPGSINGRVLMLCFLAGSLLYRIKEYVPFSGFHAITSAAIAILLLRYNYFVFIAPLPAAYVTVYLGLQNPPRTAVVESGDYSYGTYLYGGPIQQTVALSLGAANNWFTNVAVALPATVLFALLSWHLVEKPFLKVKRYILSEKRN